MEEDVTLYDQTDQYIIGILTIQRHRKLIYIIGCLRHTASEHF